MSNEYHILFKRPAIEAEEMPPELEALAQQLVKSGQLRINADNARNFITYSGAGYDKSFSYREMSDPNLLPETKEEIARTLPGSAGAQGIANTYQRLLNEFKRTGEIPVEKEMKIARLLVQATHPSVMLLCLIHKVDIFVSYSHNVADLMAMHFWESDGKSGGLQSVSGDGAAVYVSCGGDPFITKDEHKTYTTDGFPALARMLVIAAQELGHYADIARDKRGNKTGRHSAHLSPVYAAKEPVREARLNDQKTVRKWQDVIQRMGLTRLHTREKHLVFMREYRKGSLLLLWQRFRVWEIKHLMRKHAAKHHIRLLEVFPLELEQTTDWASNIVRCLDDMAFNLAPDADVYKNDNPVIEEAIACIEALARVPQQVMKWGHDVTRLCWPNLYTIYYDQVIPANIEAYEILSGKTYHFPLTRPKRKTTRQHIFKALFNNNK